MRRLPAILSFLLILDAAVTVLAVLSAPYPAFVPLGSPAAYLNIYIHVPVAMTTYLLYTGSFIAAILFLVKRKGSYDRLVLAFTTVGSLYAAYTLMSGSLWAAESWGTPWNWDPRETGVLLLFLAYLVYFALRASIVDPDRKPVVASVYAVAAYAMVPVSYLAPRIAASSLHPTMALLQGFMGLPEVKAFFYTKLLLVALTGITMTVAASKGCTAERFLVVSALVSSVLLAGAAAYLAVGYLGGTVTRVYAVFGNASNPILLVRLGSSYVNVTVDESLEGYAVNGKVALVGHVIKLLGFNGSQAQSIQILAPFCVIANLILYALLISGTAYTVYRLASLWKREAGSLEED